MSTVSKKPYPKEFRDDVVRVARSREPGVGLDQIAKDFGIHFTTLYSWMKKADMPSCGRPEAADPAARAGERGPAPGCGLSVAGEPAGKMMYPLVRELAADGIPVTVTCRVLKLARQPYYRWLASPITDAELTEAYLANALFDAHRDDPEFGYRFLADEARDAGQHDVTSGRCGGSVRDNGWWSVRQEARKERRRSPARRSTTTWCAVSIHPARVHRDKVRTSCG
jgi:putative transposase